LRPRSALHCHQHISSRDEGLHLHHERQTQHITRLFPPLANCPA
jgi:hypothetical protein